MIRKIILFALFSSFLYAKDNVIYVYGYADTLAEMLKNISLFYTTSFNKIIQASLIVGLAVTIIKSVLNPKANVLVNVTKSFVISIIVVMLFFYAKPDKQYSYVIKDETNNITKNVSHVPIGLGKMLEISTTFERTMTDVMEQALQNVNDEVDRFSKSGFIFPLKAKMLYNDIQYNNTPFQNNVGTYLNECLLRYGGVNSSNNYLDNLLWGGTTFQNLSRVNGMHQQMGNNLIDNMKLSGVYQGFLVNYVTKDNEIRIVTCKTLYEKIRTDFKNIKLDKELYAKYKTIFVDNLSKDKALNKMNSFVKLWSNGIDDSNEILKHNVLLNTLNTSFVNRAETLGVSAKASVFGLATAQMHSKEQFTISTQMAITHLPELKAMVHVIVVALSPLLMLFAILFMNAMFAKTFVTLHLWIVLWNPIIAIINFMITDKVEKIVEYLNSQGISPFSVIGSNYLDGVILDYIAFEGTLWWLVPLLAMAIATGSAYAFTQLATSLGQQFSSASMMGARQVTSMATQGSQSIRDGSSTYTKDGTGVTRNFTDVANGQKVDYAMRYGNTDTMQELEAKGTNFHQKYGNTGHTLDGSFSNLAVGETLTNSVKQGFNKANNTNITTGSQEGFSKIDTGSTSKQYSDSEQKQMTEQVAKIMTESKSFEEALQKLNNAGYNTSADFKQYFSEDTKASFGAGAGANANVGKSENISKGANASVQVSSSTSSGAQASDSQGTNIQNMVQKAFKSGAITKADNSENQTDAHSNTQQKTDTSTYNTSVTTLKSGVHSKVQNYTHGNSYGTENAQNRNISQNAVASYMNATLQEYENQHGAMSIEDRIKFNIDQASKIGNMTAGMTDTKEISNALGLGINAPQDGVSNYTGYDKFKHNFENAQNSVNETRSFINEQEISNTPQEKFRVDAIKDKEGNLRSTKDGNIIASKEELAKRVGDLTLDNKGQITLNGEKYKVVSDYEMLQKGYRTKSVEQTLNDSFKVQQTNYELMKRNSDGGSWLSNVANKFF